MLDTALDFPLDLAHLLAGLQGRQLAFHTKNGAHAYRYEATLFVTGRRIFVIEAATRAA